MMSTTGTARRANGTTPQAKGRARPLNEYRSADRMEQRLIAANSAIGAVLGNTMLQERLATHGYDHRCMGPGALPAGIGAFSAAGLRRPAAHTTLPVIWRMFCICAIVLRPVWRSKEMLEPGWRSRRKRA